MAVRKQEMLVQRLASARLNRPQANQHTVGIIKLRITPLRVDAAILELGGAFGPDRGANHLGLGIVCPTGLGVEREIGRRGCGASQREQPANERAPQGATSAL